MTFNNLPLQDMIRNVVSNATEKLASDQSAEAQLHAAVTGAPAKKPAAATEENEATDPSFVEKLASACDFIAENVNRIESPNRGVLGQALAKMAGEEMAPAVTTPDQLSVQAAMGGTQKYKHDKPKGFDAAASTAATPEGKAGLPGGATQMANDMDSAPGGNNSSVPTAAYPAAGVLHAGATKTAGLAALVRQMDTTKTAAEYGKAEKAEHKRIARGAGRVGGVIGGIGGAAQGALSAGGSNAARAGKALGAGVLGAGIGYGSNYLGTRVGNRIGRAIGGEGSDDKKEKTAGEIAREKILSKLAGEDVMKANISGGQSSGGALVGDGELQVMDVTQTTSNPTDGSGYGNQQRGAIASNEAAMNYTKGDAKKPRANELKEVLKTPAFDPGADSKLREQLRNSGSAGVKIAGANSRELLKQAAAEGLLNQETVNQFKELTKQAQMGAGMAPPPAGGSSGMTAMAGTPPQNPKVAKLKAMMMSQKESMGDGGAPTSGGM